MISPHKDLFRFPVVLDKLSLLRRLLDDGGVDAHLALALFKVIHNELSADRAQERSAYKRYAEAVEALRRQKNGILEQVVETWKAGKNEMPAEWFQRQRSMEP